jgi:copper(I)-binding protein
LSLRALAAAALPMTMTLVMAMAMAMDIAPVQAADSGLVVLQSRATASLPGAGNSAVYLTLHNAGARADRLLSVSSPQAAKVELHATMMMSGGVAMMQSLPALDVPLGGTVSMTPGGVHLMVSGVRQPLQAGGRLSLTLKFEQAGSMTIAVPIVAATAMNH